MLTGLGKGAPAPWGWSVLTALLIFLQPFWKCGGGLIATSPQESLLRSECPPN
jgi:hypothetical protein